jgi:hypothetical protein
VARADQKSQPHAGGQDATGVEDYVVRTEDGEAVGTVEQLLRRDGRLLLVVGRRMVPWSEVESVDHEALAVWLRLSPDAFEESCARADADAPDEEGFAAAERDADVPRELVPPPEQEPAGPVDRPLMPLLIGFAGAVAFTALIVVAAATAYETPWVYVGFVVPAVLAVATVVVMYRAWRSPYEPRGTKKP